MASPSSLRLLVACLLWTGWVASGAVWNVTPSGSHDTYPLFEALTLAQDGDTLALRPGAPYPCGGTVNQSLTLASSEYPDDGAGDWEIAQFDCTDPASRGQRGLHVTNTTTLVLRGLSFVNGVARQGGALSIVQAQTVEITDCVFEANMALGELVAGGAVFIDASRVALTRVAFRDNHVSSTSNSSTLGGGCLTVLMRYSAAPPSLSSLVVDSCTFQNCTSTGPGGGALRFVLPLADAGTEGPSNATVEIKNSVLEHCAALSLGGAICVQPGPVPVGSTHSVTLDNCTLTHNNATESTASHLAITVQPSALPLGGEDSRFDVVIRDCQFRAGRSISGGGVSLATSTLSGGYAKHTTVLVEDTRFSDDSTTFGPGALEVVSQATLPDESLTLTMRRCIVEGCSSAISDFGATAFYLYQSSGSMKLLLESCQWVGNLPVNPSMKGAGALTVVVEKPGATGMLDVELVDCDFRDKYVTSFAQL